MKNKARATVASCLMAIHLLAANVGTICAQVISGQKTAAPVILNRDQASTILPSSVFFHGQSAAIQQRNSAGLRLPGGGLVLMAIVDTSGYASSIQQTYQAYLITEVPLTIGGRKLAPGAYGFGFLEGNKMVMMDIGGNEIFRATTVREESLTRPTPLQVLPDEAAGTFRLYLGRSYVSFTPSSK